jgi:hypothetical protein
MSKDPVRKTKDVRAAVEAELGFDPLVDAADITVRSARRLMARGVIDICDQLQVTG